MASTVRRRGKVYTWGEGPHLGDLRCLPFRAALTVIAPNPADIAVMTLIMPLIKGFVAEISKLPPEQQQQRVARVLAALRGDVQ